jgi:hypothetical protein
MGGHWGQPFLVFSIWLFGSGTRPEKEDIKIITYFYLSLFVYTDV